MPNPNFTKSDPIPKGATHDWPSARPVPAEETLQWPAGATARPKRSCWNSRS